MSATPRGASLPAVVGTAAVVATVIAALIVLGAPSTQRQRRFDARRTEDLARIAFAIDQYSARHQALPAALDTLVSAHQLDRVPRDPETSAPYPFTVTGPNAYTLCATFRQPSDEDDTPTLSFYTGPRSWRHGAGQTCFDLAAKGRP